LNKTEQFVSLGTVSNVFSQFFQLGGFVNPTSVAILAKTTCLVESKNVSTGQVIGMIPTIGIKQVIDVQPGNK